MNGLNSYPLLYVLPQYQKEIKNKYKHEEKGLKFNIAKNYVIDTQSKDRRSTLIKMKEKQK